MKFASYESRRFVSLAAQTPTLFFRRAAILRVFPRVTSPANCTRIYNNVNERSRYTDEKGIPSAG